MSDKDRAPAVAGRDGETFGRAGGYAEEVGHSAGAFGDGGQAGGGGSGAGDQEYSGQTGTGYGRSPGSESPAEAEVRRQVSERLEQDPFLDASRIQIVVQGGEVSLSGVVTARGDKQRAENLAKGVEGVDRVHDELKVQDASDD